MTGASRARQSWAEALVRAACFAAPGGRAAGLTIGAELELLVVDEATHAVTHIFGEGGSRELVREVALRLGWTETLSSKGVPRFLAPRGGSLTFEPGGQIEYASGVHTSVDGVLRELCIAESGLREAAAARGIELLACGVDPYNGAEAAALQLHAKRYERMARYFATIGADGARMMRQTASLQVNVGGIPALERWRVANAIAPWLVALFANSPRYAGEETGCASYRAATWRGVDPTRTGVLCGTDAVAEYTSFALGANAFLLDVAPGAYASLDDAQASDESFAAHLGTLFPEVRPRGYLEFRSMDALSADARTAALVLVTGIVGDPVSAAEAASVVGEPDPALLSRAGRDGLRDSRIASTVTDLVDIALRGGARLGPDVVSSSAIEKAMHWLETRRREVLCPY